MTNGLENIETGFEDFVSAKQAEIGSLLDGSNLSEAFNGESPNRPPAGRRAAKKEAPEAARARRKRGRKPVSEQSNQGTEQPATEAASG